MVNYEHDMQLVVNPENPDNVVRNSDVWLYDSSDLLGTTPISLTDPSGLPQSNPLRANNFGYTPPFIATSPVVKWKSGGFEGFFYSFKGLRDEALAAAAAADQAKNSAATAGANAAAAARDSLSSAVQAAEAARKSASDAAALVGAPADAAVANLVLNSGTATGKFLRGTFAPAGAPPVVGLQTGGYDRRLNLYNFHPAHLRRTRAALGRALAGTGACRIAAWGESTLAGFGSPSAWQHSWPSQMLALLSAAGYPIAANRGPAAAYTNFTDGRWDYGVDGWQPFSGRSNMVYNGGNAVPLTFTPVQASTEVSVTYSRADGIFEVLIDDVLVDTITADGVYELGTRTWTGLPNTVHKVSIRRTAGTVFIGRIFCGSSNLGVQLYNAAVSGSVVNTLAHADFWGITGAIGNEPGKFPADLVFLQCMINDTAQGTLPGTWKAETQTAILAARATGADVVLVTTCPAKNGGPNGAALNFTPLLKAAYELSDSLGLPLIDMHDRWGTANEAEANGLMFDGYHPNQAGYAAQARAVFTALGL